ncbi:MAG: hypothetical protein AB1505_24815 [Candidatus Latescibacterota bacterium]
MRARGAIPLVAVLALVVVGVVLYASAGQIESRPRVAQTQQEIEELEQRAQALHQSMGARLDSLDVRLQEKMSAMGQAGGDETLEALRAVVEELVVQRSAMRRELTGMVPQMLGHMAERLGRMPGMEAMVDTLRACPMVQEMGVWRLTARRRTTPRALDAARCRRPVRRRPTRATGDVPARTRSAWSPGASALVGDSGVEPLTSCMSSRESCLYCQQLTSMLRRLLRRPEG